MKCNLQKWHRFRFLILSLLLISATLLFCHPSVSKAAPVTPDSAEEIPVVKNGFVKEADGTHYYVNGKSLKGRQYIGEYTYCFNPATGVMVTNGWYTTKAGNKYYLKKNGTAVTGKKTINKKTYIFSDKGCMLKGFCKDYKTGKRYYTGTTSGVIKTGWKITPKNSRMYFGKSGAAYTGKHKIKKHWYYFKKNGHVYTGKFKINNKLYYATEKGAIKTGAFKVGNKRYYATDKGVIRTGKFKIGHNTYYATNSGVLKTGLFKIGNSTYYANAAGVIQAGKFKTGNKWYYADATGVIETGKFRIGNCLYYTDKNGAIYRTVDGNKKMVALTFDDGPSPYTPIVLNTLEKYDAVATFFVVGNRVPAYPSYVKRAYNLGCEIGTHTYDHAWLNQLSAAGIKDEIKKGSDAIVRAIGVAPTLMRPPGGCINETVRKNVGLPMILWSVDTRDWETRSTPTTITRVVDGAYDGAVILVHDLHESTAIASKTFIPRLIKNGYQLVTISEMAELRGITMKAGETYNSFR